MTTVKIQTHTFATQSLFPIMSYKEPPSKGSCTWSGLRGTNVVADLCYNALKCAAFTSFMVLSRRP